MKRSYLKVTQVAQKNKDIMDDWRLKNQWFCNLCNIDIRKCGPHWDCEGPRHHLKVISEEIKALEEHGETVGLYVDPDTGKFRRGPMSTGRFKRITKGKALNTQSTLGKE